MQLVREMKAISNPRSNNHSDSKVGFYEINREEFNKFLEVGVTEEMPMPVLGFSQTHLKDGSSLIEFDSGELRYIAYS